VGREIVALLALVLCVASCSSSPTAPQSGPLAAGRWSSSVGQCLSVADQSCNFAAGCGHGVFPRPVVNADGTFEVDGTYRIEAGPISIDPAPPAHFSGSVSGSTLMLTVRPATLPAASYSLSLSGTGTCSVPCL
jgi:hypothetical protein